MRNWKSSAHVKWECLYHVVIIPKYRRKVFFGRRRKEVGAIRINRELLQLKGTLFGQKFWARGYCVSTVGLNEELVRKYIREQENLDKKSEQTELDLD